MNNNVDPTATVDEVSLESCELDWQSDIASFEHNQELGEELFYITDGLEAIHASLEEVGEVNEATNEAYRIAADTHLNRLGIESQSDEVSMEKKVSDTLQRIWEAIKEAIRDAIDAITRFVKKLIGSLQRMAKRAKAYKEVIKDLDKRVDPENITVRGIKNLHYSGFTDTDAILTGFKELKKVNETMFEDYLTVSEKYYTILKDIWSQFEGHIDRGQIERAKAQLIDNPPFEEDMLSPINDALSQPVSGGRMLYITDYHQDKAKRSQNSMRGLFTIPATPTLIKQDEKILARLEGQSSVNNVPLTPKQMDNVLDIIIDTAKMIEKNDKAITKVTKERSDFVDVLNKKLAEHSNQTPNPVLRQAFNNFFRGVQKDMLRPLHQLSGHSFRVMRGLLYMVDRSIKAYNEAMSKEDQIEVPRFNAALPPPTK